MPHTPQRPYVPTASPATPRAGAISEFRLRRPFVHGAQWNASRPGRDEGDGGEVSTSTAFDYPMTSEEDEELPPVEHFIDALPAVDGFAPDAEGALFEEELGTELYASEGVDGMYVPEDMPAAEPNGSAWADTDWQQYDWRAAAALGEGNDSEASTAWSTTDWEVGAVAARDARESAAQAIANALDHIAARLRHGDLAVMPADLVTDPAAIAATLAALLGVRR